ncbi:MAG: amino acid amidase [Gemmatimonadales bacterium]|nr:MAG: amino acid amidase [Gemmatimonadales bacterium]
MQPITEYLEVNGVNLFTRTIGEGPDVVVLHGGPGAHHDYLLPYFDHLASGRRLRYYDQRGGGRSPIGRHVPAGWREHVADLRGLLEEWDIARATLLGFSWGGLLALLFAISHPDRVGRLALVSPAAPTAEGRKEFERRFSERASDPAILSARDELARSGLRERDPEAYARRLFELAVAPYFRDPARTRLLTPFRVTGRIQQAAWDSLGAYDLRHQIGHIRVPAIVLHGRHDPMPLAGSQEIARLLGAPLVIFEQSGHVPYVEEPERFTAVLDQFLPRRS